jgi:hypothetical protein
MIDRQDVAREHFPINDDLDIENFAPIQQLMKPASAHLQPVSITLFHALPPQSDSCDGLKIERMCGQIAAEHLAAKGVEAAEQRRGRTMNLQTF